MDGALGIPSNIGIEAFDLGGKKIFGSKKFLSVEKSS
jgi:hypothetical protein